jgi:predicted amidophosphoribosyltransferase
MTKSFIDLKGLEYFTKCMKEYVNMQIDLKINKSTNCPNCGAPLTRINARNCSYCGTPIVEYNIKVWTFSSVKEA